MARKRRIQAAKISHISLVPKGANKMPVIYKADDGTVSFSMLCKAASDFDEQGELAAIVYAPEIRDSQGDIASAAVIKEAMYESAREGVEIDIKHDQTALSKNQAFIAESFIVQKGDERFDGMKDYDGNPVDATGAWGVVIKIDDPALREKYRSGEWNGVSMGGTAVVTQEKSEDLVERFLSAMEKRLGLSDQPSSNGDIDMKPEELADALAKSNESLAKSIVDGVKAAFAEILPVKKEEPKDEPKKKATVPAPIFKGNPLNEDDILAHQRAVALHSLRKDVDWADQDSINDYVERLAAFKAEFGDFTEAEMAPVSGRPAARPARKSVAVRDGDDDLVGSFDNVSKEDLDCAKTGLKMAEFINKQRGFSTAS